jgi:hypothetical protein
MLVRGISASFPLRQCQIITEAESIPSGQLLCACKALYNRRNTEMGTLKVRREMATLDVVDVVFTDARGRRRRQTCEVKDLDGFKNHFAKSRAPNGERIRSISVPRKMKAIV